MYNGERKCTALTTHCKRKYSSQTYNTGTIKYKVRYTSQMVKKFAGLNISTHRSSISFVTYILIPH